MNTRKMKTIPMNLCLLLSAGILLCMVTGAQALTIGLELQGSTIVTGQTFDVDVMVDGVPSDPFYDDLTGTFMPDGILGFGFDVISDLGITLNDAVVNTQDFWDDSALFPDTDVAGSADPDSPVSGDGIRLATLTFLAESAGDFSLGILSDLTNMNQGLFIASEDTPYDMDTDMDIHVSLASVPEPSTGFLLGTAILGLAAMGRRNRGR